MLTFLDHMRGIWMSTPIFHITMFNKAQIPLGSSRLDTTRHFPRVEPVELVVETSVSSRRVSACSTSSTQPKRIECRDVTWPAKWNLGLTVVKC